MKVDSAKPYLFTENVRERTDKNESGNFANALLSRMGGAKDSYVAAERESDYLWANYSDLFLNATGKRFTGSIKTVETERPNKQQLDKAGQALPGFPADWGNWRAGREVKVGMKFDCGT